MKSFNKLDKLLQEKKGEDKFIFSYDVNETSIKNFFYKSYTEFMIVKTLIEEDNNLYELIESHKEVKLYFDLEAELKDNEDEKLYKDNFIEALKHILYNDFEIFIKDENYYTLNSSRQNKCSYHLIFKNIKFQNMAEQKTFILYLLNRFENPKCEGEEELFKKLFYMDSKKELLKCVMDSIPYNKNQNIRLINQSKLGKGYLLKSEEEINIMKTFISYDLRDCNITITKEQIENLINKKGITKRQKEYKAKKAKIENTETKKIIDISNWVNFCITGDTLLKVNKLTYDDIKNFKFEYKKYLYLIPNNNVSYNHFMQMGYAIKSSGGNEEDWKQWAKLSNKYNEGETKSFINFKIDGRTFNINSLKKLAKMAHPEFFNTEEELFNNYFNLDLENINIIEEKTEFVSMGNNNILHPDKFLILYAYLGRGKTTAIKRLIETENYKKFLFISPRVSFSLFISQEFNIDNYTDSMNKKEGEKYVNIETSKKLIISVESLHKINIDNNYECIFLDESEAILNQFSSPTMKDKYLDNYNILIELINNAKKVVCADAFLTNRTLNFIKSFDKNITLLKNNSSPVKREAERFEMDKLPKKILIDLNKNIKPYICSSTSSDLSKLEEKIKEDIEDIEKYNKSLFYYGGLKREDKIFKQTLKNINDTWTNSSFVATTPTNTVGCSFSKKDEFDNVYMMCNFPTCSVRDMFQMNMRVRHIKSNKLYFSLPDKKRLNLSKRNKGTVYFTSLNNFESYNKDKLKNYIEIIDDFINSDDNNNVYNNGQLKALKKVLIKFDETPKPLRDIIYFNLYEQYISNTHYEKMFYKFLDICGYTYDKLFIQEKTLYNKKIIKNIQINEKEDKEDKEIEDYDKIENINEKEVKRIIDDEKRMNATSKEKIQKEKYYFKEIMRNDIDNITASKIFFNVWLNPYKKTYINKAYEEKNNFYVKCLDKEINESNKVNEMLKGKFVKMAIIQKIKKILKIKNLFDTSIIIKREDIETLIPFIETNRKLISDTFNIEDKLKTKIDDNYKYKSFCPYIQKIIFNWTNLNMKVIEINKHNRQPQKYKLMGENFYELVKDYKQQTFIKNFKNYINSYSFRNNIQMFESNILKNKEEFEKLRKAFEN